MFLDYYRLSNDAFIWPILKSVILLSTLLDPLRPCLACLSARVTYLFNLEIFSKWEDTTKFDPLRLDSLLAILPPFMLRVNIFSLDSNGFLRISLNISIQIFFSPLLSSKLFWIDCMILSCTFCVTSARCYSSYWTRTALWAFLSMSLTASTSPTYVTIDRILTTRIVTFISQLKTKPALVMVVATP